MKDGPEPMDVDWTHGRTSFPIICWHCNKPGHYARECPNAFDVRMMTMEEKLELIPKLLALADISGVPPSENNFEAEIKSEQTPEKSKEDFGSCSG